MSIRHLIQCRANAGLPSRSSLTVNSLLFISTHSLHTHLLIFSLTPSTHTYNHILTHTTICLSTRSTLRCLGSESESCLVLFVSLQPHVLYSSLNSPGQKTGVGSLSLLQGSLQPRNWTGVSCTAGGFFTNWTIREAHYVSNLYSFTLLPLRI